MSRTDDETPAHIAAECQNCCKVWPLDLLDELRDPLDRVWPGDEMPAGECPDCGCSAMLIDPSDAAPTSGPEIATTTADLAAIAYARRRYALPSNDDIEIDDHPKLSHADDGTWVAAWVWVPADEVTT